MKLAETVPMGGRILTRPFVFFSILVLIFFSLMLGVSQQAVADRMAGLRRLRPDLFDIPIKRTSRKNTVSLCPETTCRIKVQF